MVFLWLLPRLLPRLLLRLTATVRERKTLWARVRLAGAVHHHLTHRADRSLLLRGLASTIGKGIAFRTRVGLARAVHQDQTLRAGSLLCGLAEPIDKIVTLRTDICLN